MNPFIRRTVGIVDVKFGANVIVIEPANLYGCDIGDETFIGPFVEIQKGAKIGKRCRIQSHSFVCELVTIGDDCFISHGAMFINDLFGNGAPAGSSELWRSTKLGNHVSVGTNTTILPVTICDHVVTGAGAVVTKDIIEPGIYAGNPARLRRRKLSGFSCLFSILVFGALLCGGCQNPLPPLPNPPGPHTAVRLSPGDTIKASYADESIPDQTQKIRRDGKVSLPLIGEVTAAGKRVIDFQHELINRYEGKLDNSEVLVTLDNGTATVIVSGFANKPAVYSFDRPTTVYQVVMEAGGPSDYGSASNIRLTRIINGVQRTETINLRPTVHGQPTLPKYVQDGDVIYIARNWF